MNVCVSSVQGRGVIDEESLPDRWGRDRRLERDDIDRNTTTYVGFVYQTDDIRVRIRPPAVGRTEEHELVVDSYPETELAESHEVRTVTTADSAVTIACSLMKLLDGAYDGPATVGDAIAYATDRVRPADVPVQDYDPAIPE